MTTLKAIFERPVDRPIEGVIKADDQASLRLEIEEYVLTKEIEKRLESFLEAYNSYQGANGVWLSGFFGSGKSHLLKMLALMLENHQIEGISVLDLILPKCGDNEILRGDLKRAVSIPSKSILFNIDQKADVISKTEIDALLSVFVKVFDDMCGYYGKQGHIAQFERDLDSRGLYDQFKTEYSSLRDLSWQRGREQALMESKHIAKAYAKVSDTPEALALGILDKYRSQYKVSIEDFADQVQAYLDKQEPHFRLNFFVDEVGQYVADNVKLMTNLQTIAESLATKCRGRAWIIVTAQEDMSSVVGEMSKQQGNDFSKIQARFANRMKLTSVNVAEVIQKRLLMKNEEGIALLSDIYQAEANNFKTLFDFADGSQTFRNFQDRDHFIHSYPFIPYQFDLFQAAIQSLSQQNAFEGRHSSVGERSMLGVFQQVAIHICSHKIGQLATFDLMFEGIRTTLKSDMKAIWQAEKNLDNAFAIRLMKTLFLVKYVKSFKPTIRNLCVLMLDKFNQDLPQLRKQVEEALNLLEQQTYIQRNGELYEYLTDDEKDIEQEIKNTEVEPGDVATDLEKLIFDYVIKNRKIRYENGQDYSYSKKVDDKLFGKEYELSIQVMSPFHENIDNHSMLQMQNMGKDELLVLMPSDDRLVRDLIMYKRTEKFIRHNITITQQEAVKRILTDKGFQNRERFSDLEQAVRRLLEKSKLFVSGSELELSTEDAQNRIVTGFYELIARVYPNLRMLRGISYTEADVAKCLKQSQDGLFGTDVTSLSEAEQEILAFIQSNNRGGVRTTLKNLIEKFERKPYGWYYAAILCTVAHLCARGKVEVRADGNLLADKELERALKNTVAHGNVVLEPQVEFTASQIRLLKEFYEDFFDTPPNSTEAKALGKETGDAILNLKEQLKVITSQAASYPFLSVLTPVITRLEDITGKPYTWYLTELLRLKEELLDSKEQTIDPIRKFMTGPQRTIYDQSIAFTRAQEPNFAYINSDAPTRITETLLDPYCFKGNRLPQVKTMVEDLEATIDRQISAEVDKAIEAIQHLKDKLSGMPEYAGLTMQQQDQVSAPFSDLKANIQRQNLIAVIRDTLRRFEEVDYQKLLTQVTSWAKPEPSHKTSTAATNQSTKQDSATSSKPSDSDVEYVASRSISVNYSKAWLADEADVDDYLSALRHELVTHITNGKRIQI